MAWGLIEDEQDMTWLDWSKGMTGSSNGVLLKTIEIEDSSLFYYKASSFDTTLGFYGVEVQVELIASRILDCLGIDHVHYELVNAVVLVDGSVHKTWLSRSKSYLQPGEERTTLESILDSAGIAGGLPALEACIDLGIWTDVCRMCIADYILANRDRHGANIEVVLHRDGGYTLAPLFDFGLSLTASYCRRPGEIAMITPLKDFPANNYLGYHSLTENLSLIDIDVVSGQLGERIIGYALSDLAGVLPEVHLDMIRRMLIERWLEFDRIRRKETGRQSYSDMSKCHEPRHER